MDWFVNPSARGKPSAIASTSLPPPLMTLWLRASNLSTPIAIDGTRVWLTVVLTEEARQTDEKLKKKRGGRDWHSANKAGYAFHPRKAPQDSEIGSRGGSHFSHSSVMPALSSARSSLAPLVLLVAMRHGQSLIPQSKHPSRVFSACSGPGAQETSCRMTPNSRRPATAAPPVTGSRMGKGEVMSTSAATADGNAAEDVRQVCVKIRNTACFSSTRGNTPPRSPSSPKMSHVCVHREHS